MGNDKKPKRVKRIEAPKTPEIPSAMAYLDRLTLICRRLSKRIDAKAESKILEGFDERLREMELSPNWLKDLVSGLDGRVRNLESPAHADALLKSIQYLASRLNDRIELAARSHVALKDRIESLESREIERLKFQMAQAQAVKPGPWERFLIWFSKDETKLNQVVVNELKGAEITITVSLSKRLRLKLWLAMRLFRIGCWLIVARFNVNEVDEFDGQDTTTKEQA